MAEAINPVGSEAKPILELENICKSFPGVKALQGVSLTLYPGEIHALMGENGAGKSTLLKVMFGAHHADEGTLRINGETVKLTGPADALSRGISMVHQELSLVPQLSAVQNIMLGRERSVAGFLDWKDAREEAIVALRRLEFTENPDQPVGRLSIAQQQLVELARALAARARVIILDEPTASLSTTESEKLFAILRDLRAAGHALVYVSHRMAEVFDLSDRMTVLRDGCFIGTEPCGPELTEQKLIQMMVGRALSDDGNPANCEPGETILRVSKLSRQGCFDDISFEVRRGEIVGMGGMVGAGRTDVARSIAGADRFDAGVLEVKGKVLRPRKPAESVKAGVAFLTEDRKHQGLALGMSLAANATLTGPPAKAGFISRRTQTDRAKEALARVSAHMPVTRLAGQLSGGNQQKVVLAKWLLTDCDIFIFDEPTRGVDVGAKAEIYALMRELADNGAAILMISSEMPELLRMSDRVLVMREGHLVGELSREDASEEAVVALASGGKKWSN